MAGHGNTAAGSAATGSAPAGTVTRGADTGPRALRVFTTHPVAGHLTLLLCYLAAGVAVTWPRASYITGRLPSMRDSAAYVWGFWWMARRVSHQPTPGSPTTWPRPRGCCSATTR
jgi:hypothetical protein